MAAASNDAANKPHPATDKRREQFRKEGKFPKARDLTAVATIAGVVLALALGQGTMTRAFDGFARRCYGDLTAVTRGDVAGLLVAAGGALLTLAAPTALAAACAAVLFGGAQAGFRLYPKMLEPKLERLNPIPRLKQLLTPQHAAYEVTLAMARVSVVGYVCYTTLEDELPGLLALAGAPVTESIQSTMSVLLWMTLKAAGVLLVMAVVDYTYNRHKLGKEMRMSTQDLKQEQRQYELDPKVKGKLKQRMREVSKQRILAAVSQADVIITNPTHIAVALRYAETDVAPVVIAKGHDQLALRIRAEARKHSIPIVENRAVARSLHAEVEMGESIGAAHYVAVAEVLAFVFSLRAGRPPARARA